MTDYPRRNRFVRVMDSRAMTRVVQVIAFMSLLLSLGIATRQYQLASCLAKYNNAAAAASGPRLAAAEEDRQAIDEMVKAVVHAKARGDAGAALHTYLATRESADRKRAKNPPPPPPSEVCR